MRETGTATRCLPFEHMCSAGTTPSRVETAHPASLAVGRGHVMGFWLENEMETFRASALYCLCLSSPVCMQTPPGAIQRRVSPSGGQVLGSEDLGPQRLDPPRQDSQILYDP